jgi:Domain of unknown function (DUF4129)
VTCPPGATALGGACQLPAATVRDRARQILGERQFRGHSESIVQRFENWMARTFDHILGAFFSGGGLTAVGVIVAVAIVVAALVLAARFALRVQADPKLARSSRNRVSRQPVEWAAQAALHEAAGEWRDALRCRYRALVAELSLRGVLEEIPGRTAREYENQVQVRLPSSGPAFDEASDLFEAAWYGNQVSGYGESERFKELAARVLTEAPR